MVLPERDDVAVGVAGGVYSGCSAELGRGCVVQSVERENKFKNWL